MQTYNVTDQTYEEIKAKLDLLQAFTDKCGLATTESVTVTDNVVSATVYDGNVHYKITPLFPRPRKGRYS